MINESTLEVLPAIHALTGCDTTSQVGTKGNALKVGFNKGSELLSSFKLQRLDEDNIQNAEKFLVNCISKNEVDTFDELRHQFFHEKHLSFDIERFPPTSVYDNTFYVHIFKVIHGYIHLISSGLK